MKKYKGYIFSFLLGVLVFGGGIVIAKEIVSSDNVAYIKDDGTPMTASQVIDELYGYYKRDALKVEDIQTVGSAGKDSTTSWSYSCNEGDIILINHGVYGSISITGGFDEFASVEKHKIGKATSTTITGTVTGIQAGCGVYIAKIKAPREITSMTPIGMSLSNLKKGSFLILTSNRGSNFLPVTQVNIDINNIFTAGKITAIGYVADSINSLSYSFGNYGTNPNGYGFLLD